MHIRFDPFYHYLIRDELFAILVLVFKAAESIHRVFIKSANNYFL